MSFMILKRPSVHHIIILLGFIVPFINFYLSATLPNLPLINIPLFDIFSLRLIFMSTVSILSLFLYVVFFPTYLLFIIASILLLLCNIYLFCLSIENTFLLLIPSIFIVCILYFIIQVDFYTAYIKSFLHKNKPPHLFRLARRTPLWVRILVDSSNVVMRNLSKKGCYIEDVPENLFVLGQEVVITIDIQNFSFSCVGIITSFQEPNSYGIEFDDLTSEIEEKIDIIVSNRDSLRIPTSIPTKIQQEGIELFEGSIHDISAQGCFIEMNIENIQVNQPVLLDFEFNNHSYKIKGNVLWANKVFNIDKPIGIGICFLKKNKKLRNAVIQSKKYKDKDSRGN